MRHNGDSLNPGQEIDANKLEAERLVGYGAAEYVEAEKQQTVEHKASYIPAPGIQLSPELVAAPSKGGIVHNPPSNVGAHEASLPVIVTPLSQLPIVKPEPVGDGQTAEVQPATGDTGVVAQSEPVKQKEEKQPETKTKEEKAAGKRKTKEKK